jgi:hypothetical protein
VGLLKSVDISDLFTFLNLLKQDVLYPLFFNCFIFCFSNSLLTYLDFTWQYYSQKFRAKWCSCNISWFIFSMWPTGTPAGLQTITTWDFRLFLIIWVKFCRNILKYVVISSFQSLVFPSFIILLQSHSKLAVGILFQKNIQTTLPKTLIVRPW